MQATDKHGAQMRGAPRIKVFQPAVLRCGAGAPKRVHLLNVSTGGALVYGDSPPNVGTQVQLACGISLGSARVQWSSGRRFGVAFARPIGPAEIEAIVSLQDDLIEVIPPAAIPAR
ncbi:PilZ domain-containing protein [Sphingomonas sp. LM7]|uniref:PilZ domain-containing protein n=1 Tax=Sphingomonas sp. LM7 TaxID=1938607 RepID=UPI0015586ACA|nr:PilZ domain-containing protein [Sphingomonas sp. LM7]